VDTFGAGSLTDVAGVRVGHHQRIGRGWQTGTTVVFVPLGAVAAVDVRGGGPGTRETDALDPRNLVDRVHAICLSGGSAFGLAAADGVMQVLEQRRLGVSVGPDASHVVPVVPAAVIFDLGRGGRFDHRPTAEFGAAAIRRARATGVPRGAVGAGSGARAGSVQGGVGMASTVMAFDEGAVTVAALAVVNSSGSAFDPRTAAPWAPAPPKLRKPTAAERASLAQMLATPKLQPLNTTIGVVVTDAELTRPEAGRLAQSAHDGLARAVRPAHGLFDGDTIFGLATGRRPLDVPRVGVLDRLYTASAEVFAAACVDAVLTATTVGSTLAYRDVCPSAFGAT
jgi:L-aminopeptidase/D-esterase-like protein